jgi:hypothetical protein
VRILVCGINYAPDLVGITKFNAEPRDGLSVNGYEVKRAAYRRMGAEVARSTLILFWVTRR